MAGEISGIKWNDLNNNGVKDANESGLADWTIYLDQNKNGQLDAGEKSTTTDANGNYKFTGLTAGAYTVAEVQKPGWTQTFPTAGQSTLIPIKDRRDLIFDPSRKLLYMTTSDGDVERFDINSKSLLTPFDVGNSLNGGDITSDGSALYVAENQRGATQGFVRKVNLSNGAVTNITYNLESWDDKPWDISISSNGKGLLSLTGQWTPLYDLNLSNDTLTKRNDLPFGFYYAGANINRSQDRNLLFLTDGGISSGPIFTYAPATNTFPKQVKTDTFLSNSLSAVNRNGSLIAMEVGTGISIMDANLNSLENLSNVDGGMVFDPLKDVLYAADSAKDQIVAFDTNTWKELYRLNIGEDIKNDWDNSSKPLGNGVMTTSDDGQYLFMSTPNGVRMLNLNASGSDGTHTVNVSEGQAVTGINFGNKQVTPETATISGIKWNDTDSDGVRDVGEAGLSGWTIYLDQNQNGKLDTDEKSTTTDANGKYTFSELTPGSYTVAEVQKTGWQQTFPGNGTGVQSVLIPIKDRRDLVFDPTRNLLYITTSDGDLERYNVATQTLLTPYDVGNSLNGGDITPDGSALYVAEGQRGATQGFIRKVNLSTGSVTNITYNLDFGEGGAWDLNIASNGKGFLSTGYEGSGWTPFRELNLSNDTLSIRQDAGGSGFGGEVSAPAYIFRGSDRNLFFMTEGNISSGPIFTYNALTNTFPKKAKTDTFLGSVLAAINRDSSLIATEVGTGISIMDANFNGIENLTDVDGGMAFDPVKDVLYAANTKSDQIIAFDTNTWKELYRFNIGEDIGNSWDNSSQPLGNGVMTVSDDGKYLFMSTPNGVRMFNLTGSGPTNIHQVNVSAGQVVTDINFGNHQTAATAKLSIDNVTVTEGNSGITNATFTVSLDKASTETITVNYGTANDTAIAGQDYTAKEGLLTFAPGQTTQQIQVSVIGDTLVELNETFKVNLTKATNAEIITSVGLGTILNDDSFVLPQLSIGNAKVTEGDSGTKDATFTVSLSAASTQTVTVNYITADESAIAGQDYKQTSGILTFAPGQTTQTIAVPVIGDTIVEPDETFKVNLSNAINAKIAITPGVGTILNDDSFVLPQLSIGNAKVTEGDSGTKDATFTVSLSAASTQTVTVNYITADESAIAGQDYKQTSGILTFAPGQTTQTIAVPVIGDTIVEPDETFKVNLSNGTNATIAVASGVGTILNDDSIGGNSGNDSLMGTSGHDTLDGGAGHDTIKGLAGHDWLKGGLDHDLIDGGDGHDTVDGGSGYDTIYGGKGNDSLIGGEGDDEVYGGQNNDLLNGGDGDDILYGGQNKDTVIGGAGDDELYGDKDNDVLIGVDSLDAAPGVGELDTLTGGQGIDRFVLGDAIAKAYYNDGKANSRGTADFALITDFNIAEDFIQLAGKEADYVLSAIGGNTNIYLDNDGTLGFSSKDELIGSVAGVTSLNLADSYFLYV